MEENRFVAIVGDNPEALLLSVLYAEAGISNYLVGPFGDDGRTHANRPGLEEALWLLGIFKKSGKIRITPDYQRLPLSQIKTLILTTHVSSAEQTNALEMTVRNLAHGLATGTSIAFAGLCKPRYTSSIVKSTIEKHGGLKIGIDMNLYYIPLFWAGERIREFKEKRKVLAGFDEGGSNPFPKGIHIGRGAWWGKGGKLGGGGLFKKKKSKKVEQDDGVRTEEKFTNLYLTTSPRRQR